MVTSERRKWLALALLSVVQFMVVLDIAIVNVALPSIQVDLGFSQENLQWVISAYALVFGGFLLLGGRAADLLGRRRIFLAGVVVFTVASLLAGLAWSEASLIAARALQGLGAAIITPAALSILSTTFVEGRERNIALGVWGAVGGFGAAAGVLLGGILTDALSWEWIFFVNVPVGVGAFAQLQILLPGETAAPGTASGKTATLNSAALFIRPGAKIVSIEDTREINLPHENWIPGTTRSGVGERGADGKAGGEIDMYDLVRAALRHEHDRIGGELVLVAFVVVDVGGEHAPLLELRRHVVGDHLHAELVQDPVLVRRLEREVHVRRDVPEVRHERDLLALARQLLCE